MELTPEAIVRRVEEIRVVAHDAEQAHGLEDDLYRDVLQAIFDGQLNPRHARLAAGLALLTQDLGFSRWAA